METLWQDIRYGLRMLARSPAFTVIAVLTLALGIGANTAIFSVVNAVILHPLPYRDASQLAFLWTDDPKRNLHEDVTSVTTFNDWRALNHSFSDLAIFTNNPLLLTSADEIEKTNGVFVSANIFQLLGVSPVAGRTFTSQEEKRGEPLAVISYGMWQRRFGGSQDVIGRSLTVDGDSNAWKNGPRTVQVIGVMPAGFYFPDKNAQLWEPATVYWRWQNESTDRFHLRWGVIGRLNDGVTLNTAQRDMAGIGKRLTELYPPPDSSFPGFGVNVVPVLEQITGRDLQFALWLLLGAVSFVLLIACGNVANLLLARGAAREREFAVRTALGAGRMRLVRQLLAESITLAIAAGIVGFVLAAWGVKSLVALAPAEIPRLEELTMDSNVFVFTATLSIIAGLIFGLAPAWKISHADPNEALKEGGGQSSSGLRQRKTRGLLVVVECALAVVLLTGAGLLIRSFHKLNSIDPGFRGEGALVARVVPPPMRIQDYRGMTQDAAMGRRSSIFFEMLERIAALPGVTNVGAITHFLNESGGNDSIHFENQPPQSGGQENEKLAASAVSPEFFSAMGVRLLKGRPLTSADRDLTIRLVFHSATVPDPTVGRAQAEAVLVNEAFVRRYFRDEDPLGKRFYEGDLHGKHFWYEIVGEVADMRRQGLDQQPIPEYFGSLIGGTRGSSDIVIRMTGNPLVHANSVRDVIHSVDKLSIIDKISTVESLLAGLTAQRRFQTWALSLFAGLALALSAIGIFGVTQYSVAQRTHEIGIRMALGASSKDVMEAVLRDGLKLVIFGLAAGLIAAWWLNGILAKFLFELSSTDPATFIGVAALLFLVAFVACWIPARRASRVDPMIALRYE